MTDHPMEIPFVTQGELTVLHVEPGDFVRIQLQQELTEGQRAALAEWWDEHLPDVPALIMLPDESVDVVNGGTSDPVFVTAKAGFSDSGTGGA